LIEWLRLEMSGSNPLTLTNQHANTYVMLLRECCDAKLIELAHIDNDKIAIRYRLTTVGEYWIDPANDTISEPAAREPQADSERVATQTLEGLILDYIGQKNEAYTVANIAAYLYKTTNTIFGSDAIDHTMHVMLINRQVQLEHYEGSEYWRYLAPVTPQPDSSTPVSDSGAYRMGFVEGLGLLDEIGNQELAESLAKVSDYLAEHHLNKPGSIKIDELLKDAIRLRSQLAALASERDAANARVAELEAENAVLGIVISSVGIKVHDARDLLFDEKYAAADGELKNAEVIIRANRGNDATD
jgi:hypothetical protein